MYINYTSKSYMNNIYLETSFIQSYSRIMSVNPIKLVNLQQYLTW